VTTVRTALCAALLLGLGGCISLFPKVPPAQLYRFGVVAAAPAPPPAGGSFNVIHMSTAFTHPSEGDRLLTVNGTEAAYIAAARWDAPASILFDEAEQQAFDQSGGAARLLHRGDPAAAPVSLALNVESFEARYSGDPKAAPTVVVTVHATLVGAVDRRVLGDQTFVSRQPASDNRVAAIVEAFNAATNDVLTQIVGWTDQRAAGAGA
jgi:cholesterol transport system auxiliary component